jgi:CheY-like chemotaxis protein
VTEIDELDMAFAANGARTGKETRYNAFFGQLMEDFTVSFNELRQKDPAGAVRFAQEFVDANRSSIGLPALYGTANGTPLKFYQEEQIPVGMFARLQELKRERGATGVNSYEAPEARQRKFTVLFMDDEPGAAKSTKNLLEGLVLSDDAYSDAVEIESHVAERGQAALDFIERQKGNVDLIVADVVMPEMDGSKVLHKIEELYPRTGAVVLSAYGQPDQKALIRRTNSYEWLNKPVKDKELFDAITWALHRNDREKRFT